MIVTTEAKVTDKSCHEVLRSLNQYLSQLERKLYVARYIKGIPLNKLKSAYISEHKISSRHFNSLASILDGKISSKKELTKDSIDQISSRIQKTKQTIQKSQTELKKIKALQKSILSYRQKKQKLAREADKSKQIPMPKKIRGVHLESLQEQTKKVRFKIHQKKRRLNSLEQSLEKAQSRSNIRLCFGSRKLQNQQHHLKIAGFSNHDAWRDRWRYRRSSQSYFLGTHSEPSRNQNAQYDPIRKILKLRLPDALASGFGKTIDIPLCFSYKEDDLRRALTEKRDVFDKKSKKWVQRHVPVSYRVLEREKGTFYIQATFEALQGASKSVHNNGGIGVDLNADHIAVCEVDRFGNPVHSASYPFSSRSLSKKQLSAVLGDHIAMIVKRAAQNGRVIYCEDLDFSKKKKALREEPKAYRSMLSRLANDKFYSLLASRCHREGITLRKVNPAFTSLIGFYKFRGYRRMSSHELAALAIARRGLRFSERPKTYNAPFGTASISGLGNPALFLTERLKGHVWSYYSHHKKAIRHALSEMSQGRGIPPPYSPQHPSGYQQIVSGGSDVTKVGKASIHRMSSRLPGSIPST